MTGILGVVLSLGLLIYLAYRGVSVLLVAPLMALLAVLFSGGTPLLATYTQVFMPALGKFAIAYFPLFLLGALFGKLMDDSGSARVIAQGIVEKLGRERAVLAIVLACAVLTYGGVSLFVVAFAVYPIAVALFRESRIPKRLIPPTIALGAFTFTMTALPGTPAIQNAIPMPYFDTTPFAAPGLGILAGAIMLLLGMLWLSRREKTARGSGEGFGEEETPHRPEPSKEIREHAQGEGYDVMEICPDDASVCRKTPGFVAACLPVVLVIGFNYVLTAWVIPAQDTSYLALPQYGSTTLSSVRGVWAIIGALVFAAVILIALNRGNIPSLKRSLDDGAAASVLPLFNTASLVGFGAVIAALPAFAAIRDGILGIAPGNPLISLSIAVNALAGITGSASGGMSIALQTLGETYLEMGRAAGISPELLHRVTSIATGGLDALPQNGAVITLLTICKLTHRDSYADIFVVAAVVPILALVAVVILGTVFGSF
jgi:H+/gluconate symporter-like permease